MLNFFQSKEILDEASIHWMLDCYAWALRNFDAHIFFNETRLVLPNNDYFPGQETSANARMDLILQRVKHFAGMDNWPVRLVDEEEYLSSSCAAGPPKLLVNGSLRGTQSIAPKLVASEQSLLVVGQPQLLHNPQALIASYAQMLAHYLGHAASEMPPGDLENWPHVTELLAVFLGFGLMFANTAYNVRVSSCGSCQGPSPERINYLSQYDITYALAIFASLKEIPVKQVTGNLKKTLHTFYKKALKDLSRHEKELNQLRKLNA